MSLEQHSYAIHQNLWANTHIEQELSIYRNWFDHPTVDLWRHLRMLSVLNPFLKQHKKSHWLTVGDGRFGTSATYINRNGGIALPSDIDVTLLDVAKQQGMIPEYQFANAESLPFQEDQFDYSYCKQSYHHFPRPLLAVYEMLRVSKQAVIFTEPHEFYPAPFTRNLLQKAKHALKSIIGRSYAHHDTGNYETIGNYVYAISVREFEKVALGLSLPAIAYKRIEDVYITGVEHENMDGQGVLYKKIKRRLFLTRLKTFFKIAYPNTIQMIIFKTMPADSLVAELKSDGFVFTLLPKNPY